MKMRWNQELSGRTYKLKPDTTSPPTISHPESTEKTVARAFHTWRVGDGNERFGTSVHRD